MELTQDNFDQVIMQAKSVALVDFYAPWCGPCKVMGPIVDEIAEEMPDVTIGKVNVDDQPALAQQHNILSIPTFLIMKGGQVVEQFSGAVSKDALVEKLKAHMS